MREQSFLLLIWILSLFLQAANKQATQKKKAPPPPKEVEEESSEEDSSDEEEEVWYILVCHIIEVLVYLWTC